MTWAHNVRARRLLRPRRNVSDSFDISYAAHTSACTFLLDAEGVCRRIVVVPGSKRTLSSKGRDAAKSAARCVGAQYVATLDPNVTGMLAEMPRVGAAMLFACVDARGRVSLVRTGLVTRFERYAEDPFVETEKAPSTSVQTSAPMITPSAPTPRMSRSTPPPAPDVYEEEASDRTQPIQALRPAALRSLHRSSPSPISSSPDALGDEDATLDRTAEYESRPAERSANGFPRRTTWPSPGTDLGGPGLPVTLRQPPAVAPPPAEDDPYATLARGTLPPPPPRRSEPYMVRTRSDRSVLPAAHTPRSPSYPPAEKLVSGRRRDR